MRADALSPFGGEIFVNYVRRARTVPGRAYYVIPELVTPCGSGKSFEGASLSGFGGANALTVGALTAAAIAAHGEFDSRGTGIGTRATVEGLVPDGVATATLHFPAAPAHGVGHPAYRAVTITAKVVENVVVFAHAPRGAGLGANATMTWRAANGRILKTFHRL